MKNENIDCIIIWEKNSSCVDDIGNNSVNLFITSSVVWFWLLSDKDGAKGAGEVSRHPMFRVL